MTIQPSTASVPNLPGLYVNVIPPQTTYLTPAETDILGIVGTAVWGPVDAATECGDLGSFQAIFGAPQNRKFDLGTPLWAANLQGAQNFRCVRVTDSTDVAATGALGIVGTPTKVSGGAGYAAGDTVTFSNGAVITVGTVAGGVIGTFTLTTQPTVETTGTLSQTATSGTGTTATFSFAYVAGLTLAAKYTGSLGNQATVTLSAGAQANTQKAVVFLPGVGTETFNNIGAGLSGTALWAAIVSAINNGNAFRAGSNIVVATAGSSSAAPTGQSVTLTGGTDGASVSSTQMLGADTNPRTGMYALRKQGCSVGLLSDCDASASWATQQAFAISEGVEMIGVTPAGDTISNAVSTKASNGIDSYGFKLLFGDWCYFNDTINGLKGRLVSPQGFVAGWIAANGPQYSPLNKQLQGIIGTQKTATNTVYQDDELITLNQAGFDVITNPVPGGAYFGCRLGHNTSSNTATRGDNYTRMTNFIADTIDEGLGPFIGQLQSPTEQQQAKATLDAYFNDLWTQGAIGTSVKGQIPWNVSIGNNQSQVTSGQQIANVQVAYLSVIEQFVVNLEGGQTVVIASGNPQSQTGA